MTRQTLIVPESGWSVAHALLAFAHRTLSLFLSETVQKVTRERGVGSCFCYGWFYLFLRRLCVWRLFVLLLWQGGDVLRPGCKKRAQYSLYRLALSSVRYTGRQGNVVLSLVANRPWWATFNCGYAFRGRVHSGADVRRALVLKPPFAVTALARRTHAWSVSFLCSLQTC